jgi:ribosomal protein S27AE
VINKGDKCPKCGENQMPKINLIDRPIPVARACQKCGWVESVNVSKLIIEQ